MFCFIFASFLFENATPSTTATFVGLQTQLLGKSNFRSSNYFKASLVDKRNLDAGPMIRVGGWGLALELRQQLLTDCAKLMSDIDYKQGLDTIKNQMLDSEEFTKEEVASC